MPTPYIFTYQTICKVNGKSYIGVHSTNRIDDGYIGCGIFSNNDARRNLLFHRAVRKYGYENFMRYELSFFDTYQEALAEERYMVNSQWVKLKTNYNAAVGGEGNTTSWMDEDRKTAWKNTIKEKVKIFFENGGKERVREGLKNGRRARNFGSKNGSFGKANVRRRRIIQYDRSLNVIKTHGSLTTAAAEIGSLPSNINACCLGKHLTCKGYVFRFEKYSAKEAAILKSKLNRPSKAEYNEKRLQKVAESFLSKGRKRSIKLRNVVTGEVVYGITRIVNLYNNRWCFRTIKNKLIKKGVFKDWVKE